MPLITRRASTRALPRVSVGRCGLIFENCAFRQPKLVATHLCLLFGSRESRHYARANTFMGPDPSASWALLVFLYRKLRTATRRRSKPPDPSAERKTPFDIVCGSFAMTALSRVPG